MARIAIVVIVALALGGCSNSLLDRNMRSGALIGAGTGAIVGGIARRSVGGAVAGGVIGAVAGAAIGAIITRNNRCYVRLASGRLRRIACP
jgi:hypothetical protein